MPDPSSGELNGQGQPIQAYAQLSHLGRVLRGQLKIRPDGAGPLNKQFDGCIASHGQGGLAPFIGQERSHRHRQRGYWELMLATKSQGFATGSQDRQARRRLQPAGQFRRRGHHMLKVVQDQQELSLGQPFHQPLFE